MKLKLLTALALWVLGLALAGVVVLSEAQSKARITEAHDRMRAMADWEWRCAQSGFSREDMHNMMDEEFKQ